MNLDDGLLFASLLIQAVLVGLLTYRRAWRSIPFFCVFCVWEFASNVGGYVVLHYFRDSYRLYYLYDTAIDSVLEFSVLIELAWSVLRPIRSSLPRQTPWVIAILVLGVGAAIWPFSGLPAFASLPPALRAIAHVEQTTSILRVLFFLALAGSSQLLSIGWRDRELQVASGLGFSSLVILAMAMLRIHESSWAQYRHSAQITVASYMFSLIYWIVCFAQKEAERREFTPQMQNLLLAVAGVARAERTALTASSRTGTGNRDGR